MPSDRVLALFAQVPLEAWRQCFNICLAYADDAQALDEITHVINSSGVPIAGGLATLLEHTRFDESRPGHVALFKLLLRAAANRSPYDLQDCWSKCKSPTLRSLIEDRFSTPSDAFMELRKHTEYEEAARQQQQQQQEEKKRLAQKRSMTRDEVDLTNDDDDDDDDYSNNDDDNDDESSPEPSRPAVRKNSQSLKGKQKPQKKQKVNHETTEEIMQELREMPGMEEVVAQVEVFLNDSKANKYFVKKGMSECIEKPCYNLIFTGGAGTGKTTVARLIGRIFCASGFLSKGHMIEAGKGTLEGKFLGETAPKTQKVLESATGGVLFIDEAYSLASVSDTSGGYGEEAIATMLPYMEDHRDDLVVIAAGYKDKIENLFLKMNDGLPSRFPYRIDFPDYTPEQLMRIFIQMATKRKYQPTSAAKEHLQKHLDDICEKQHKDGSTFGNARLVRNLLDKAISSINQRVVPLLPPNAYDSDAPIEEAVRKQLLTIEAEDIRSAIQKTIN